MTELEWLAAIAAIAGTLATVIGALKIGAKFFSWMAGALNRMLRKILGISDLQQTLIDVSRSVESQNDTLNSVLAEVLPNGGSSLKDAVSRIERRQILFDGRAHAMMQEENKPMFEADVYGNCVWVNRKLARITGRSQEDLRNNGWINIIHEDDREAVVREWRKSVSEHRSFSMSCRIELGDTGSGGHKSFKIISYPIRDENFNAIGYLGVWRVDK